MLFFFFFLTFEGICSNFFCQFTCPFLIHLPKKKMFAMWCNYKGKVEPWGILKQNFKILLDTEYI